MKSHSSLANRFDLKAASELVYYTHNEQIRIPAKIPARKRIIVHKIIWVPKTLRTADPGFMTELESGQMGLSGHFINIDPFYESPFDIEPPTPDFDRDLHDFRWLRHLERAAETPGEWQNHPAFYARKFVASWIDHAREEQGWSTEPQIFSRRVLAWISHSRLLLEGAPADFHELVTRSLGEQIYILAEDYIHLSDPAQRLHFLIVLLIAGLTIAGQEDLFEQFKGDFMGELAEQMNEDGHHRSLNPKILKNLLLDLVPLLHCIRAREKTPPPGFEQILAKMMQMLRFLRLGDGRLPRFCGTGASFPDEITTLLSYDENMRPLSGEAPASRMYRLGGGSTLVMAKASAAPPLNYSHEAHADCLSFEMTVGPFPFIVNCGTPRHDDSKWRHNARLTPAQSVLAIEEQSSADFIRLNREKKTRAVMGLQGPAHVAASLTVKNGFACLKGTHDGYVAAFGFHYHRDLEVALHGLEIRGTETLHVSPDHMPVQPGVTHDFAVHFHLHPDVQVEMLGEDMVKLTLPDGEIWRFTASGAQLLMADSVYLAMQHGALCTQQIVLTGPALAGTIVRWRLQQEEFLKQSIMKDLKIPAKTPPAPPGFV